MSPPESRKILPLEALRGMAAICVVLNHFSLAFLPEYINLNVHHNIACAWVGQPLFFVINGSAMVIIFFVLSGYVLSLKGLETCAYRVPANAAIRRWLRFVPLISAAVFMSYILFRLHCYHYGEVYAMNKAEWFSFFFNYPQDFRPSLYDVIADGLFGGILLGNTRFDTVLWTMPVEFFGSIVIFLLAMLLAPKNRKWLLPVVPLTAFLFSKVGLNYFPFLLGYLGVVLRLDTMSLNRMTAWLMLVCGIYFSGFYLPTGWYAWLLAFHLQMDALKTFVLSLGGFLLLIVFATRNPIASQFDGSKSRMLGKISFPLYLLHALILASFCSKAYLLMGGGTKGTIMAALTLMLALPPFIVAFARLDAWWLKVLSRGHAMVQGR